jgi:hypothetical protein
MIYFNFNISNPWKRLTNSELLKSKIVHVFGNKYFYIGYHKSDLSIIGISFDISPIRRNHAGVSLTLSIFGRFLEMEFYDNRHWNSKQNCWEEKEDY